jgi:hypothetical protein
VRSNEQLIDELRMAPEPWMDAAIVVAFESRFEFVGEDHPYPVSRLNFLASQGGIAIGLAGLTRTSGKDCDVLSTRVFSEFVGQAWAYRYMDILRGVVRNHSSSAYPTGHSGTSRRSRVS